MSFRVHPDADGWINTVTFCEGFLTADQRDGKVVSDEDGAAAMEHGRVLAWDGQRLCIPHDDRRAWVALRSQGLTGPEAYAARQQLRALQDRLPDAPGAPPASDSRFSEDLPEQEFEAVPGLRLRQLVPADLDLMAPLAVETGIYPETCPGDPPCCRPASAHAWCQLAARIDRDNTWQMTLEYRGRPLQCELVEVGPVPTITLTMHFNRERPHWFWREAERPVLERLRARGAEHVLTRTRKDRPDWIQSLKDNYAADEMTELETTKVLRIPLATAPFTGWPARRSAGPGWVWQQGGVRLWEGWPGDLPAVEALIDQVAVGQVGGATLRARLRRMLEEWWDLDRATLLLSSWQGVLESARLVRPRRGTRSGLSFLTQFPSTRLGLIQQGVKAWHRAVGYTHATMFTPDAVTDRLREHLTAMQAAGGRELMRHTKFRVPLTEWEVAID